MAGSSPAMTHFLRGSYGPAIAFSTAASAPSKAHCIFSARNCAKHPDRFFTTCLIGASTFDGGVRDRHYLLLLRLPGALFDPIRASHPYATWRWLLALALVGGGLLTSVWIQDWIASSASGYREVLDTAIGIAVTIGFVSGVGISALTLFLRFKKVQFGYRLAINIAGLPATVTSVAVLDALRVW